MNNTKSYRKKRHKKTQRRRKQMRGGLQYIGQYTDGVIGTFEFEAIDANDLYYNRKFYEDNIDKFKCPFLDRNDIAVIIDSYLNTKDYALDTGTYRYLDGTQENKVFFLYFVTADGDKHLIGFISCSIYRPRNICYVNYECSDAVVIKSLIDIGDRRVEKASHVLQAFFINYLDRMGITTIYKQLRTYDHPGNEYGDTLIPCYNIMLYNLDTGFQLYKRRQVDDISDLAFLDLRNDHYSKFDITQFNEVHPTLPRQSSYYTTLDELVEMLGDTKRYEPPEKHKEIDEYIGCLNSIGGYSHIERLTYMRDLCNMLNMNLFSLGKPKPKKKEETVLPRDKASSRRSLKAQSLLSNK